VSVSYISHTTIGGSGPVVLSIQLYNCWSCRVNGTTVDASIDVELVHYRSL